MPRLVLIPGGDPKQALRLRRFFAAASSSLLVVFLLAVSYAQGMLEFRVLIEATIAICGLILLFYAVFRTGLNLYCRDQSLTMQQIVLASLVVVYVMYQAESLRGILLVVYLMPLLFAQFRLDRERLLLLVLLQLLAYAGMVLFAAYAKPGSMDAAREVTRFVVLCTVSPWFAAMGGYLHNMRARLKQSSSELQQTLEDYQRTNQALQESHAELDRLASTDRLTGAWNRRRMEEAIASELDRLNRHLHRSSILILDIDFFKNVNDRFGHAAGDQLLVELAAQVRSVLRTADSLTRWGGEEFVVLCPDTDLAQATVLAGRLREKIAGTQFSEMRRITVSIGVAECMPGEIWEQWFQRADAALFRAKDQGRNQVQVAAETTAQTGVMDAEFGSFVQLVWSRAYESGHAVVDRQHRALFRDSNELFAAKLAGRPANEVDPIVDTLLRDLAQHFRDEESIITAAGYPNAAGHAAMHETLLAKAGALLERFRAGNADVGELLQYLAREVVARHILDADRKYFAYLAKQRQAADH